MPLREGARTAPAFRSQALESFWSMPALPAPDDGDASHLGPAREARADGEQGGADGASARATGSPSR